MVLITIQLQNFEEVNALMDLLINEKQVFFQVEKAHLNVTIRLEEGKEKEGIHVLKEKLKKIILEKNRITYWKNILENEFFYLDPVEHEQIIEMAEMILDGKRKDVPVDIHLGEEEKVVDQLLDIILTEKRPLSLKSFLTFRLRSYFEKLSALIEVAIDEYKLEQEFQSFIQYLREFLQGRIAQMKSIYIYNDEDFRFYDEKLNELKRSDLQKRIDRKLLTNFPIYVDSMMIAPLLSIAPKQIFLYTDDEEQSIIQTLSHIFEEKLLIRPLAEFVNLQNKKIFD